MSDVAGASDYASQPGRVTSTYNFTTGNMVLLGAAGGAGYAKRPNAYERPRWEIKVKMDGGGVRIVSHDYEPALREGDRVRVYGTQLELVPASSADAPRRVAALAISDTPEGERVLAVSGRLDARRVEGSCGIGVARAVADAAARPVIVDASGVDYCDGAGAALFVELLRHPRTPQVEIRNLRPPYDALVALFDPEVLEHDLDPEPPRPRVLEEVGRAARGPVARHEAADRVRRRNHRRARARVHASAHDPLARRLAHRRAGRAPTACRSSR